MTPRWTSSRPSSPTCARARAGCSCSASAAAPAMQPRGQRFPQAVRHRSLCADRQRLGTDRAHQRRRLGHGLHRLARGQPRQCQGRAARFSRSAAATSSATSAPTSSRAIEMAKARGMKVFGIVGRDGGYTKQVGDVVVVIPTVDAGARDAAFGGVPGRRLALPRLASGAAEERHQVVTRAVFLDRDGVINAPISMRDGKPCRADARSTEFRVLPGVDECGRAPESGRAIWSSSSPTSPMSAPGARRRPSSRRCTTIIRAQLAGRRHQGLLPHRRRRCALPQAEARHAARAAARARHRSAGKLSWSATAGATSRPAARPAARRFSSIMAMNRDAASRHGRRLIAKPLGHSRRQRSAVDRGEQPKGGRRCDARSSIS